MADMFRLAAISAFADNYIWVLHDSRRAIAVDPGDAAPLQAWLSSTSYSWRRYGLPTTMPTTSAGYPPC